jgi:predicted PurR-regulated permease PerM
MPETGPHGHHGWTARRVRASGLSVMLALLVIVAVLVAQGVFLAASQPIGWVVAAAAVALVVSPLVDAQARFVPRGVAIVSTILIGVAFVTTVGVGLVLELQQQLEELGDTLPAAAAEIEEEQGSDSVLAEIGLSGLVRDLVDQVSGRVAPPPVDDAVGTIPSFFVSGVLVVFFLVWGRALLDGAQRQITDPDRRRRVGDVAHRAVVHTQGYVVGALALSIVAGGLGGLLAWWAGLSTPLVLGALIGVVGLIPYVGVLFGGTPMLLLSAATLSITTTLLLAVALIALQAGSTTALRLVVEARSLRVGPAVLVVALLIGSDVYGIGGALVALVGAVLLASVIDEVGRSEPTPA